MVIIFIMEEFDKQLKQISALVKNIESAHWKFEADALEFLRQLEEKTEKYSLPIQPQVALIRGKVICGPKTSSSGPDASRKTARKEKHRFILEQLEKALTCINDYFSPYRKLFTDCEQVCTQLIVRSVEKGLYHKSIEKLLLSLTEDPELAAVYNQVLGLAGSINIRILLERAQPIVGL